MVFFLRLRLLSGGGRGGGSGPLAADQVPEPVPAPQDGPGEYFDQKHITRTLR